MKTLKLSALLLGAALFVAMGSTSLAGEGMKCGNGGKCGKAMEKPAKCGSDKNTSKCGGKKAAPKCGKGKCGS